MTLGFIMRKGAVRFLSAAMIAGTALNVHGDEKQLRITNYELRIDEKRHEEKQTANESGEHRHSISPQSPLLSISSTLKNPFQFSGYYKDTETDFYYCNARYYSPQYGLFTSRDTYDLDNRFAYCDADPVNRADPEGHAWREAAMRCLRKIFPCLKAGKKSASVLPVLDKEIERVVTDVDEALSGPVPGDRNVKATSLPGMVPLSPKSAAQPAAPDSMAREDEALRILTKQNTRRNSAGGGKLKCTVDEFNRAKRDAANELCMKRGYSIELLHAFDPDGYNKLWGSERLHILTIRRIQLTRLKAELPPLVPDPAPDQGKPTIKWNLALAEIRTYSPPSPVSPSP